MVTGIEMDGDREERLIHQERKYKWGYKLGGEGGWGVIHLILVLIAL